MAPFGGYDMPIQYEGIIAEHNSTRSSVTMFDTCHMGRFVWHGPSAADDLSRLLTQDAHALEEGRCRYGFILREDGGILDDQILYRLGLSEFMLVVNAGTRQKDFEWLVARKSGATIVRDITESLAKLDIQGPSSPAIMAGFLDRDVSAMRYFRFGRFEWEGVPAIVSRSGYTGEDGFELYLPSEKIVPAWRRFLDLGVKPAGLGARDTLRLEAGLPLYGHELSEEVSPVEAGMERYLRRNGLYIGAEAVRNKMETGVKTRLAGFKIAGRQSARNGNTAFSGDRNIGTVTSGSFGPTLGYAIGFAYMETEFLRSPGKFEIDVGRRRIDAEIAQPQFYRRSRNEAGNT